MTIDQYCAQNRALRRQLIASTSMLRWMCPLRCRPRGIVSFVSVGFNESTLYQLRFLSKECPFPPFSPHKDECAATFVSDPSNFVLNTHPPPVGSSLSLTKSPCSNYRAATVAPSLNIPRERAIASETNSTYFLYGEAQCTPVCGYAPQHINDERKRTSLTIAAAVLLRLLSQRTNEWRSELSTRQEERKKERWTVKVLDG